MAQNIPQIIENATAELSRRQAEKQENKDSPKPELSMQSEGLLYFGNPHESIPIRLLQDNYLTPKAKFAWQVIKLNAKAYQGTAFPSYEELQKLLSDKPYSHERASTKIVSQTIMLLRLCRWLTFCSTARDNHGRVLGNIYIIHDEPISVVDAIHFNDDYLSFLEGACHHKDNIVNQVANQIMQALLNDDTLVHYGSHINLMRQRYSSRHSHLELQTQQKLTTPTTKLLEKAQDKLLTSHTEGGEINTEGSRNLTKLQTSITEISDKSLISDSLPYGKSVNQYSTSTYINNNLYSTVLEQLAIQFPKVYALTALEKNTLLKITAELNLSEELFKSVLLETALRIRQSENTVKAIKNTMSYLCKMLRNAASGQFNPYLVNQPTESSATRKKQPISQPASHNENKPEVATTLTPEQIEKRLALLNEMRKLY
ncbi:MULTISPECIES: STY4528 family pathogenicity island replication protein [Pasteurellaceae]|uniref:STY4528 family pathogenicity island replication protein n=1 Tax=Pasteurellaceae TaxID=712 RepID=UPI001980CBD8|nr:MULTISPECIES: STY4528 family pathogenicity island replication protein [Pasteurellaceae]